MKMKSQEIAADVAALLARAKFGPLGHQQGRVRVLNVIRSKRLLRPDTYRVRGMSNRV